MSDTAKTEITVETLLGVKQPRADRRLNLAHSIEVGLPVKALDRLAESVAPGDARFKFRLIPKATLERRRKSKRFTAEEGDRLARIAKVYSFGLSIYRDPAKVREFLRRPHVMLDNQTPLDVALGTGAGADAVINLLGRAAYSGGV